MWDNPDFLAHMKGDDVAVAVRDVSPGPSFIGLVDQTPGADVEVSEEVPLGHKVALTAMHEGQEVIEYGLPIGIATQDIAQGSYVHTHNIRSARWKNSVA